MRFPLVRRYAAEVALSKCTVKGPGSLRVGLLDQLHLLGAQEDAVLQGLRINTR